jgi:cobalt/nickel transport system permease protein
MHIPDGYLGPATYGALYVIMVPLWAIAVRVTNRTLAAAQVPVLALGAAFSFVIMMFNIPIPGGSTGHAAGAVLVAILVGPWAALIALTVSLVVQALVFGDGGITAIGANCLNMAFIMPFSGYFVYRLIGLRSPASAWRRAFAAGIGSYVGLNMAALATAIEFGVQPLLYHTADGRALYCPYGLNVTIPVMMAGHLLLFGVVEGLITFLVIRYIQHQDASLIH